jgi:hypothetical protein
MLSGIFGSIAGAFVTPRSELGNEHPLVQGLRMANEFKNQTRRTGDWGIFNVTIPEPMIDQLMDRNFKPGLYTGTARWETAGRLGGRMIVAFDARGRVSGNDTAPSRRVNDPNDIGPAFILPAAGPWGRVGSGNIRVFGAPDGLVYQLKTASQLKLFKAAFGSRLTSNDKANIDRAVAALSVGVSCAAGTLPKGPGWSTFRPFQGTDFNIRDNVYQAAERGRLKTKSDVASAASNIRNIDFRKKVIVKAIDIAFKSFCDR